jgi:hypothetical protein
MVGKDNDLQLDDLTEGIEDTEDTDDTKPPVVVSSKIVKEGVKRFSHKDSKKNKIQVWSPRILMALWCLKKTVPDFSMSGKCREYIMKGLEEEYPNLMKDIDKEKGEKRDFK